MKCSSPRNFLVIAVACSTGCGAPDMDSPTVETSQQAVTAAVCAPAPDGIIAWWPGDDAPDDIVGDHDGTWSQFTDAFVGKGFRLPGTNEVARFPLEPIAGDFSLEFWVQAIPSIGPTDPATHEMFAKGPDNTIGTANASPSTPICDACNGRLEVRGPNPRPHSDVDTWEAGSWHHVALSYGAGTYTLYVDGLTQSGVAVSPVSILNNTFDVTLGGDGINAGAAFSGLMDEVTIYGRALSAGEIQAVFDAGSAGKCRPLKLPWTAQEAWRFTSGPHGAALTGLDFAPPFDNPTTGRPFRDRSPCARFRNEQYYVTAAAAGRVITAPATRRDQPEVVIEHHDGSRTHYFHVCVTCRQTPRDFGIRPGELVTQGQRLGHPSCDTSPGRIRPEGSHVHFSVSRGGKRIPAYEIGRLSGWDVQIDPVQREPCPFWRSGRLECDGILSKDGMPDVRSVTRDPIFSDNAVP